MSSNVGGHGGQHRAERQRWASIVAVELVECRR
jgi:hypothetical protein